ncbi:MAG: homoserine O-acetyltransferase family protein [Nitritalea sp.]
MNLQAPYLIVDMTEDYFHHTAPFPLESGEVLAGFTLKYTCSGHLKPEKDNVIWVVHALTGDAKPHEWWNGLIGEDKFYDPDRHYIVCANLLGSCYGSSHPLSVDPDSGQPYYYDFPQLTTRDMARALDLLREHLGIRRIHTLIGGSLGGQVGLEWAHHLGESLEHAIILASNAKSRPWLIAFNEAQRMAIAADQSWGTRSPEAGKKGLEAARAMAMISYRHPDNLAAKQNDAEEKLDHFRVSAYLRYQGQKLSERFDALSYWTLTKAMDSHDLGRGRGGLQQALAEIRAKVLAVGVDRDLLFSAEESREIASGVPYGSYGELHSHYGHDAFLIEYEQLSYLLRSFYLSSGVPV